MLKIHQINDNKIQFYRKSGFLGLNLRQIAFFFMFFSVATGLSPLFWAIKRADLSDLLLPLGLLAVFVLVGTLGFFYALDPVGADIRYVLDKQTKNLKILKKHWYKTEEEAIPLSKIAGFDVNRIDERTFQLLLSFQEEPPLFLTRGNNPNILQDQAKHIVQFLDLK